MTARLADTPVIETARLLLRAPRLTDFPAWEAFFRSERARHIGGPGTPGTAWRAFAHIAGMWALKGHGTFVFSARDDDRPIGTAGPWTPEDWPENEIGWTIWTAEAEGRGLAFEAAKAARDFAYRVLGWSSAVSYIAPENFRSIALAERLGAALDPEAALPDTDMLCLVYRHPVSEAQR